MTTDTTDFSGPSADESAVQDARRGYRALESMHAFIYFSPQAGERYTALGVTNPFMQYFASRGAPLGPVGPASITATFYNFSPELIAGVIPDAWAITAPEQLVAARLAAAGDVLGPALAGRESEVAEADALLADACAVLGAAGRPLYAAYADLPLPEDPAQRLFHRISLLREWRGDGHIAVLTTEQVAPLPALEINCAAGGPPAGFQRASRGWSEEQWNGAEQDLIAAGTFSAPGTLSESGKAGYDRRERHTDELAIEPWIALGPDRSARLRELLRPMSDALCEVPGMEMWAMFTGRGKKA